MENGSEEVAGPSCRRQKMEAVVVGNGGRPSTADNPIFSRVLDILARELHEDVVPEAEGETGVEEKENVPTRDATLPAPSFMEEEVAPRGYLALLEEEEDDENELLEQSLRSLSL